MKIQWYPGHMAKAKRLIQKDLRLVDVVVEIVDARIPESSRNPLLKKILGLKPLLIVLNKADLADPALTLTWLDFLFRKGTPALAVSSVKGEGVKAVVPAVNELYQKTKDTTKKNRRLFSHQVLWFFTMSGKKLVEIILPLRPDGA